MIFRKFLIFSLLILIGKFVLSQKAPTDTIKQLKEVAIVANRLENFSSGTKIQKIDSITLSQYQMADLSTLLENESPIFIKSYGMGSLATCTFRGASASQTAILWNGFNINSSMNGQLDLSMIPNGLINNVNIQYGGTSALWGSGAVGGAIHLNNEIKLDDGISVLAGASIGSFDDYRQNIKVGIGKKKWATAIIISNISALNNFNFYNTQLINSPMQKQSNAELKQKELLCENNLRINKRQKLNLSFWQQFSDRNIPPTMLQAISNAYQIDKNSRITSEWKRIGEKVLWNTRAAFFDESINYSDVSIVKPALSNSKTLIGELESKINLNKNQLINLGINNTYIQAVSNGYPQKPQKNNISFFASYKINTKNNKCFTSLSIRQEIDRRGIVPLTYSIGSEFIPYKWISGKFNIARIYRNPTFNDLYWVPGGNINLLPESGFSEDAGLLVKLMTKNKKLSFNFEPTLFNRNMINWIIWVPGSNFWSPQNILEVWSRGLETQSTLMVLVNKIKFKTNVITNYTISTNEKTKFSNDLSLGKQLIYVPIYSGNGKISIEYKNVYFSINESYTGFRFTSNDNSAYLNPYWITNTYISYHFFLKKYSLNIYTKVNNLFNNQYQIMLNRAMPLRNFQFGISIQFNKSNLN